MNPRKNILFVCANYPEPGGVETVTGLLADYFQSEGYSIFLLVLERKGKTFPEETRHLHQMVTMPGPLNSPLNLSFLDNFIKTNDIAFVFNQGVFSQIHMHASKHPRTIFINTLHSRPFWEVHKFVNSSWKDGMSEQEGFVQKAKVLLRHLLGLIRPEWSHPNIKRFYRNQIECAHWFVVLDENFKKELESKLYQGIEQDKILVMPNPLQETAPTISAKKKEVLYIGRLTCEPKRVDRLLRIWANVEPICPDWTLQIVGDGEERRNLEHLASTLQLKSCRFHGFQDPTAYYQTASILCLTSTYEGSPMVISEAQSHGTVPIVFGSVHSMYSLIDDGMNGMIVPPFDEEAFSEDLSKLMKDEKRLAYLSENARKKACEHDLKTIGQAWLNLLEMESEQYSGQPPQATPAQSFI